MSKNIVDPQVGAGGWRLEVAGLVEASFSLSYEELKAMPAVEQFTTLVCISNEIGGDLISNARWRGVPLAKLLEGARLGEGAKEVAFLAADGYSESLPVDHAMRGEVLVAYEMNGEPLSQKHGFPARLLVPGLYGLKSVKWLTGIEVVDYDFKGYWQKRGWSDDAIVKTMSRIDVPEDEAKLVDIDSPVDGRTLSAAEEVNAGGIAFAGLKGVSRVELSVDGGVTWQQAVLRRALSPYTWQLWTWRWQEPAPGVGGLVVRATDGRGMVQTAQLTETLPDGATGYHRIFVEFV